MTDIDPQVAFYLEHQEAIDTWYQLRERIPAAAHGFFASLGQRFRDDLAATLGEDVRVQSQLDEAFPKLLLYRTAWYDPMRDMMRVAVGLEWDRVRGTFHNAYVGVWLHRNHPTFASLDGPLREEIAMAPGEGYQKQSDGWWPAWRYVTPAQPRYWEKLERFADQILEQLEQAWNSFCPAIELALEVAEAANTGIAGALEEAH